MTREEYDAIDALNWSRVKHLDKSPKEFRHQSEVERDDTVNMRIGRAIHTLLLEPQAAEERHPIFTGAARRGKAWDIFCEEHPGSDPLNQTEWDRVRRSVDSVLEHPEAASHLTAITRREHTVVWTDDGTGLRCKARVDAAGSRLVELKSANSRDFHPRRWPSHAADQKYHGQIAYYSDGLEASGNPFADYPVLIVVESEGAHDVAVYDTDEEYLSAGRRLYRRLLRRYQECVERGAWPGVCASGPLRMTLPAWADWDEEDSTPITIGGIAMEL